MNTNDVNMLFNGYKSFVHENKGKIVNISLVPETITDVASVMQLRSKLSSYELTGDKIPEAEKDQIINDLKRLFLCEGYKSLVKVICHGRSGLTYINGDEYIDIDSEGLATAAVAVYIRDKLFWHEPTGTLRAVTASELDLIKKNITLSFFPLETEFYE